MKKQTRNKLRKLSEVFIIIVFMVSIFLIIQAIEFFYIGYHNVDLVFNNQYLLAKQGESIDSFYDKYNSNGDTISQSDLYIVGTEQMVLGFKLSLIGGLLLGACLVTLIPSKTTEENERRN